MPRSSGGFLIQTINWRQHWMLIFVPIAFALEHVSGDQCASQFLVAALAIMPVARLIGVEHRAPVSLHGRFRSAAC